MKRMFALLTTLLFMLSLTLGSCALADEATSEQIELKFAFWSSGSTDQTQWDTLADSYHALHPNVTIINETFDSNTYDSIYKARLAGGDGPDIYGVRPEDLSALVKGGYAMDVSDCDWFTQLTDSAQTAYLIDNEPYAFPILMSGNGILYNKSIFEQYGINVPTTFTELLSVCQTLRDNGVTPFAMAAKDNWWPQFILYYATAEHVLAIDPNIMSKIASGEATYSGTAGWTESLEIYQQLLDAGAFIDNPLGVSESECVAMFLQGSAAMFPATWELTDARSADIDVGYCNFPTTDDASSTAIWGGFSAAMAINPSNGNAEAASDYVSYLFENANYHDVCAVWNLFPVKDGVDVSDVDPLFGVEQAAWEGKTLYGSPSDNMLTGVQDTLLSGLQDLTAGKATAADVLAAMDEANEKAIEQQ